jgi:plasmid replication initiation protein
MRYSSKNTLEVVQSYIITTARYDFNVYEKRILYRVIEMMQGMTKGLKLNERHVVDARFRIDRQLFDLYEVEMPLSALLMNEEDTNHKRTKEALLSMSKKTLTYEDEKEWRAVPIILLPKIRKYESLISFRLHEDVYNALMNFSKGYKKYELKTAMAFQSPYTMRMYELFSKQRTPLVFALDKLKKMFGVEKKYALPADFIRRVIEPAKKELDEKSAYSYEYTSLKTGRKITSIRFYPVYIAKNVNEDIEKTKLIKQISPGLLIDRHVMNYLKDKYEFTATEIKNNEELFDTAQRCIPDLLLFLSEVYAKASKASNTKGYLINALRIKMKIETPKQKANKNQGVIFEQ